jgi:F-type H+-transporting ATPase subunit c
MKKKLGLIALSLGPVAAFAQDEHAAAAVKTLVNSGNNAFMAAGLCMGVAAAVVAFAQSRAAAAALEGIGRNPAAADKISPQLILSLALMESVGLLAFVIAFMIQNKG